MPINIYSHGAADNRKVAWLCDDVWELPVQINVLEKWLLENKGVLPKGSYVADIGYSPRPGASGGGGAVTLAAMEAMLALGMELYLSEYPEFEEESE
jgi:hypothetical protein